jgi:hypothetical protein
MTIRNWRKKVSRTEYCKCNTPVTNPENTLTITRFTNVATTSWTAPEYVTTVEYLVVGGGGGGGAAYDTGSGGGGGGGLVLSGTLNVVPGNSYSVVVGSGGNGGVGAGDRFTDRSETNGLAGGLSSFDAIVALGGGGGYRSREFPGDRGFGGSVAIILTAPTGGNGSDNRSYGVNGGGGGGNGSAGGSSTLMPQQSKIRGSGLTNNISGSNVIYGAGGVGGQIDLSADGSNAINNTGNGGGGATSVSFDATSGGNGGSGIVILKY